MLNFKPELTANLAYLRGVFKDDATFKVRQFSPRFNPELQVAVCYLDGMVNTESMNNDIIKPIMETPKIPRARNAYETIVRSAASNNDMSEKKTFDEVLSTIMSGDTIMFVDGFAAAVSLNTKMFPTRTITEPESERVLRGSREGFIESIMTNLSMIRRRIGSSDLKFKFISVGRVTSTQCCIVYIDGLCEKKVLDEMERRLAKIQIDSVLDSNYVAEMITDHPYSPFRTVGATERPDVVVAKLLEGRCALLCDCSPVALTAPCIFVELMQSPDDYYLNYIHASLGRIMRMICAFLSYSVPACYLALINFHHELIPPDLIINIAKARNGVPLPSFLEALLLLIAFDLLRETGLRMPSAVGQALSIVGALVLGQSAVEARFVSAPMIIVVAFSGITCLIIPRLSGAVNLIKYLLLLAAAVFGLYGFVCGFTVVLAYMFSLTSFGVPFMSYSSIYGALRHYDVYVRAPWRKMKLRPFFATDRERLRPGSAVKPVRPSGGER